MTYKKVVAILLAGVFIGAIFTWAIVLSASRIISKSKVVNTGTTPPSSPTPTPGLVTGFIEGSLGYPSEIIPETMVVCAEEITAKEKYCVDEHIKDPKYTNGVGYKLEVPTGKYTVYATIPGSSDSYRAYYDEFVVCGLAITCTSHKPIVVEVISGKTTDKVDPQDWYNIPTPTP